MKEQVVLLNNSLEPIGTADKATVHTLETPLHYAFSFFLFNSKGEFLIQQRALSKITWPGVWSNSCCGHPAPNEMVKDAVYRRLNYELGYEIGKFEIYEALPDFRYKAEFKGVVENEFCPVWIGKSDLLPNPNPEEVADYKFISWQYFISCLKDEKCTEFDHFSVWSKEEALLLDESGTIDRITAMNYN
jgi:isopentenyl-diphosphate delta-isomerase